AIAVGFVMAVALAAMAIVVRNSLRESAWGVFSILCTVPIAVGMGLWLTKIRPGAVASTTAVGVVLLIAAVGAGAWVHDSRFARFFLYPERSIAVALMAYGFLASVLP